MKVRGLAAAFAAALLAAATAGAAPVLSDLERQLDGQGADAVNAHLRSHPAQLAAFGQAIAACDLAAVSLALRLSRGTDAAASAAHLDALRAAGGRCSRFLLALARPEEVTKVCASIETWGLAQTARELRQRIAAIESDRLLRDTAVGQACRAAYRHELENTRVVLRRRT